MVLSIFYSHPEKLKLLEYELHWESYKDKRDKEEFNKRIKVLVETREDSIYVKYNSANKRFLTPEETFKPGGDLRVTAELEFRYARSLFKMFTPAGMPSIDTTLSVFQFQRDKIKKTGLR